MNERPLPVPAPDEGAACVGCGEPLDVARALYVGGLANCRACAGLLLGTGALAEAPAPPEE